MNKNRAYAQGRACMAITAAIILSGCAAGETGSAFVDRYNGFITDFDDRFDLTGTPVITAFDDLPGAEAGFVDYEGYIAVNQIVETIRAEATLTADFATDTITMTTSNYNAFDSNSVFLRSTSGNLAMTNGTITPDGVGDALITGTVTGTADGSSYNTAVAGGFIGAGGEGIVMSSPVFGSVAPTMLIFAETD